MVMAMKMIIVVDRTHHILLYTTPLALAACIPVARKIFLSDPIISAKRRSTVQFKYRSSRSGTISVHLLYDWLIGTVLVSSSTIIKKTDTADRHSTLMTRLWM